MPIIYDPDQVAFAGTRDVRDYSAATVDGIIAGMAAGMLAGGWEQVSTGTLTGHLFFRMRSQKSPWVASIAEPGDYGGRVKAFIHASSGSFVNVQASSDDDTLVQDDSVPMLGLDAAHPYRQISCPYQAAIFQAGGFMGGGSMIISAPHTPSFLQAGFGLRECLFNTQAANLRNNLFGGNWGFFAIKDTAGTFVFTGFQNVDRDQFEVPFAGDRVKRNACWIANMVDDPTFADPTKWYPLVSPAMFCWGRHTGTAPIQIKCWLWDALILNQWFADGTPLTSADGHVFQAFTHLNDLTRAGVPGTLFFCTSGPT